MSEAKKEKRSKDKVEKKHEKGKSEKGKSKKPKEDKQKATASAFSLLADEKAVDPTLSSLFAAKPALPQAKPSEISRRVDASQLEEDHDSDASVRDGVEADGNALTEDQPGEDVDEEPVEANDKSSKRKRKRKEDDQEDEIVDAYMRRLEREEAKEEEIVAAERAAKRQKASEAADDGDDVEAQPSAVPDDEDREDEDEDVEQEAISDDDNDEAASPPPKHETEQAAEDEISKANRTVFLGNVSTAAISSKSARKALITHLKSFFPNISKTKDGEVKHALESLRFRSTPYASAIPKKAAFATKQLMEATSKSTNAYAVYSTPALAREACKHLNGTTALSRHLRVDSVAHPAKVDNRRCVFVGNLGFVDDESNIQAANEEEGKETRKPSKTPADVEEGLWRTFKKCGIVESVRVIRDSTTRVGKGIAYVQFEDENAVEAALLYNEKKFPPMLPRKLRVTRAKAVKRNVKPNSGRPTTRQSGVGYQRKITGEEASKIGRTGKLFGRAAAAKVKRDSRSAGSSGDGRPQLSNGIQKPESFVFEGHRATSKSGKSGLKLGGGGRKKKSGVTGRSTAFKGKGKKGQ
ncbi:Nucleolar protein 12 [Vermiconidia calcicola]|uniref:Nucleolar protein 12 n=1 Tax=Vermiconidia calcicola TaxID=1690605 RepID=A0ACC3MV80_9PEZI|nr:Nucleolar protein 12 [Vermiconidia calcicola]